MSGKVKKPCRVCGKLFTPCVYCERDRTAFHWRTIACSEKCAKEYFRRVMEARENKKKEQACAEENSTSSSAIKIKPVHRVREENLAQIEQDTEKESIVPESSEPVDIPEEPKKKSRKKKITENENIEQIEN